MKRWSHVFWYKKSRELKSIYTKQNEGKRNRIGLETRITWTLKNLINKLIN